MLKLELFEEMLVGAYTLLSVVTLACHIKFVALRQSKV